jgi:threonine dehydrogenase-like Zn-dependent dehydrogenase
MKTIVLNEPGHLAEKDAPFPPGLGENEVLLKVRCPGICGTDLHAYKGRQPFFTYPRILGHEIAVQKYFDSFSREEQDNFFRLNAQRFYRL